MDTPPLGPGSNRCLADCALSPLSITCLTLALTVLYMRASVPADVHPLCTYYACILLTATLCIIAPSVHDSWPPNLCSTTPLVRVLVV